MTLSSLKRRQHQLSSSEEQIQILDGDDPWQFKKSLDAFGSYPLRSHDLSVMQVNLGKMCNQTCAHCHVDAGPDRKEIMSRDTMSECLRAVRKHSFQTVDITGGAPEMNPNFKWFVESLSESGVAIIVRCNLTIILANPKYSDLPQFFAKHKVQVVSSLPHFAALRTDKQRGEGVFMKSIKALQLLNDCGYGKAGTDLVLDLVHNPSGAFLPADQSSLERDFRKKLNSRYDVVFNNLLSITNMPISRFLDYLITSGNYDQYLEQLVQSFNPSAIEGLMCRSMISVGWDGKLYDCDFNQMLGMALTNPTVGHISEFDAAYLEDREIAVRNHCFGCTAGAGSSCAGEIAQDATSK